MSDKPAPRRQGRRPHLTPDEISLWAQVARTITPRPGASLPRDEPAGAAATEPAKPPLPAPAKLRSFDAPSWQPPQQQKKTAAPPLAALEKRLRQKLNRGHVSVDQVIDLHGMRQEEAHHALRGFLHRAQADGALVALVITGKGSRSGDSLAGFDTRPGVLRRAVPQWLREPDMRMLVVGFEEAGAANGGAGALYVRLRKAGTAKA